APRRMFVPRIGARAAFFENAREGGAVGFERLGFWPLTWRNIASQTHPRDRNALRRFFIKTERARAARHHGEKLHAADHAADERDIAIEVARRLAYHRVEFAAVSGIGRHIAADAHHAVAVRKPDAPVRMIPRSR